MSKEQEMLKRLIDIIISLFVLIFTFPVFIILVLLVKLDSPGPALYKQERPGLNGKRFKYYKFRTMRTDSGQILKDLAGKGLAALNGEGKLASPLMLKHDPRVTRLGRFLRKTSLDE